MPAEVGVWDKATSGERKIKRHRSVESARDRSRGQEILPWALCCKAGLETGGLGLEGLADGVVS